MVRSRRNFLKLTGAGALTLGALSLPRFARGGPTFQPTGPVKRLIVVSLGGGMRWPACFDGLPDAASNPWGLAPWNLLGTSTPQPEWGFARSLMQKPIAVTTVDWAGEVLPYLTSDTNYNTTRSTLASWKGATLPSYADIANEVGVVRVTGNPGGAFNGDHRSASAALQTGSAGGGAAGLATALYDGLKRQYGTDLDSYYLLPPVVTRDDVAYCDGGGDYASSRGIVLFPDNLPTNDVSASVSKWGRAVEQSFDTAAVHGMHPIPAQYVLNLINDKVALERFGTRLLNRALLLDQAPSEVLGARIDNTPLSSAMLLELFGASSSVTPASDILFDSWAAVGKTSWSESWGLLGAFGLRLLQIGSPIVVLGDASAAFDTHGTEVTGGSTSLPVQVTRVARMFAALEFGLKNTVDPADPGATLWDSTVVVAVSEFGRTAYPYVPSRPGGGTDHDPMSGWPFFGGPVVKAGAGGRLFQDSLNGGLFHQNRFFTTVLQAMGVAENNSTYLPWSDFPPIPGLFK